MKKLLDSYEPYYILNDLYVTDYCVWLQAVSSETISLLTVELEKVCNGRERTGKRGERERERERERKSGREREREK